MKPIISVIMATFNASATLRRCLDSIMAQKIELVELLIIDGGSTDGTQAILADYTPYIDFTLSEKDSGIYDAWNKGIAHSCGDWMLFIGSDDTLEPDAFAKYLAFLQSQNTAGVDYICAKNSYFTRDGKFIKHFGVPWRWEEFRHTMKVAHVASLHSRALFREIGMFDLQFPCCADYEWLLRKRHALRCLFLDTLIARMSTGGASFSMKALWEAHQIRRLYSGYSPPALLAIYLWQVFLFQCHQLRH